jgi:hypothetical protein
VKASRLLWSLTAIVLTATVLSLACSGGERDASEVVVIEERDGAQLVALMESAQAAIQNDDFNGFQKLFGGRPDAKTVWNNMNRVIWKSGKYHVQRLTECPGLERAEPGLKIGRLVLHEWFDLSRETGKRGDVYETTWEFARSDTAWTLWHFRIDRATISYHALLRDMQRLGYREFLTLGMDWEEYVDPIPLMQRWLEAASAEDYNALGSRMVAGVYPRAYDMNIDLPTLASDDDWAGKSNRESSQDHIEESVAILKSSSGKLGAEPDELSPYFGAYRVTSMPENCTKLKMYINFEGGKLPGKKVAEFSVEWSAAYINSRWLIDEMQVRSIKHRR